VSENLRIRPDAVEWREAEGEVVALDLRTSTYLAVNETGATLWPALIEGATRDELVASLENGYGVERERAERDLDAFLELLRDRDLLED
jgi:Coenzyme PQQ synthesis protein D (PqqD)